MCLPFVQLLICAFGCDKKTRETKEKNERKSTLRKRGNQILWLICVCNKHTILHSSRYEFCSCCSYSIRLFTVIIILFSHKVDGCCCCWFFFLLLPICYHNCHYKRSGHFHNPLSIYAAHSCGSLLFSQAFKRESKIISTFQAVEQPSRTIVKEIEACGRQFIRAIFKCILKTIDKKCFKNQENTNNITTNPCYLFAVLIWTQLQ